MQFWHFSKGPPSGSRLAAVLMRELQRQTGDAVRPVRILFANGTFEIGGADVDLLQMVRALDRHRFQAVVAQPGRGPLAVSFESAGASLEVVDTAPLKRFRRVRDILRYPFRWLYAVVRLRRLIRTRRIRLVHVNSAVVTAAAVAARLAHVPCVWHVREIELLRRSRFIGAVLRWCIRRLPDKIVAISGAVAEAVGKTEGDRMRVIHHGVDVERFHPGDRGEARRSFGLPTEAYVIGFVGRISPIKGLEDLIGAFATVRARHDRAQLVIAGPVLQYEEYYARLKRLRSELCLDGAIEFLGATDRVPELMRCFDVLVLPTRVPEGFGLVLLEALASGTPVIAPHAGGPPEFLTKCAAARLFPPGDVAALAAALEECMRLDEASRRALATYAREWTLREFSSTRMIRQLSSVYEELLDGSMENACSTWW